jgi:bifunctional UDP-N-acetylglucosamine pyrophosphorylase/glucosamine-1-phosphate N-acetyltransferase
VTEISIKTFTQIDDLQRYFPISSENALNLLGPGLKEWLLGLLASKGVTSTPKVLGQVHPTAVIEGAVYIEKGAHVEPFAMISGPCYIAEGAEIRHAAYIRGPVFVGPKAVVGHTSEVKGSILCQGAKAAHFAYVGDSILGQNVNLGAGTKLANLKLKGNEVHYTCPATGARTNSRMRKFGSILGDHAQTGCNAVLSPGTLLFPSTLVAACTHYQGTLKSGVAR